MSKDQADKKIKWKGEVTFEGTLDEFAAFRTAIEKQPVALAISEAIFYPGSKAGYYWLADQLTALHEGNLAQMLQGAPRIQFANIKGIAGGIRTPHLHLGDEVVLVDKERFKTILGDAARNIFAQRVETQDDFYDMIKPLMVD